MPDAIIGLVGAFLGASAALGGTALQVRGTAKAEAARALERREDKAAQAGARHRELSSRYLFQLTDAVESLRHRLANWADRGGQEYAEARDPGYWGVTMLYALARALGAERILALEGVYLDLDEIVGEASTRLEPRQVDNALESAMANHLFFYHRLALAESVLERSGDAFRLVTYTEFRRRYDDPQWNLQVLLRPASAALDAMTRQELDALRRSLSAFKERLSLVMQTAQGGLAH